LYQLCMWVGQSFHTIISVSSDMVSLLL